MLVVPHFSEAGHCHVATWLICFPNSQTFMVTNVQAPLHHLIKTQDFLMTDPPLQALLFSVSFLFRHVTDCCTVCFFVHDLLNRGGGVVFAGEMSRQLLKLGLISCNANAAVVPLKI